MFNRFTVWCLAAPLAILISAGGSSSIQAEPFAFHHEHVLGTSLEIVIEADSSETAKNAEQQVLEEIRRLAKIYSSYDDESQFSKWQASAGQPQQVSSELFELLQACERWQILSGGALNPATQRLTQLWQAAAAANRLPTATEIKAALAELDQPVWKLDANQQTATRTSQVPLSLNAIAKGDIIDRAAAAAAEVEGVESASVNVGGDLCVRGRGHRKVAIANPANDAINAAPLTEIYVSNQAVATSGNYRRGFEIQNRWYSHIIDPRTGQPTSHIQSATVVTALALDADALATILCVLERRAGLALVNSLPETECLLVERNGRTVTSQGWSGLEQPGLFRRAAGTPAELAMANFALAEEAPKSPLELVVNFELNRPAGGDYRRPYFAIWLEDADQFPVKTAVLWMRTSQPGPRWHRDLLRWYRNDRVRKLADQTELIGTVSSATRGPGKYKAVFNGTDDAGKLLPPGEYTLFIEAAREHGTYQLIRHKVTLGGDPFDPVSLKGNVEVKSASVEYRAASDTNTTEEKSE